MAKQQRDPDGLARFGEPGVLVLLYSGWVLSKAAKEAKAT